MQPMTAVTTRPAMTGWLGYTEPLEVRVREPLHAMLADVGAVETIYTPPTAWLDARSRWQEFLELATPNVDRLTDALVTGVGDMVSLRAQALAEHVGHTAESDLRSTLVDRIHHALSELWSPVAARAFSACAANFDSAVTVGDTAEMDAAADSLAAAARLCGADGNVAVWSVQRLQLGLCIRPRASHVRHVATAFSTEPDRWDAVKALGAQLKAADDPLTTWPELPPLQVVVDANRVVNQWDPLDGELPPNWQRTVDGWWG